MTAPISEIRTVAQTASTNEDMKALAREGAPEGLWLRAEHQTAGKGRMGRAWEGEAGNLFASTLVNLRPTDPPPASLAFVAAVAVHEVLSDFTGRNALMLKWPNDIMAHALSAKVGTGFASENASDKNHAKLCGMLLERVGNAVIIGVGVNVANSPELPGRLTISLRELGIDGCDAASLLEQIAQSFARWRDRWRSFGIEPVLRAWLERAHPPGTPMIVQLPDGERVEGRFDTLDGDGALILRLADGARRAIHAADIFLL